MSIYHLVLWVGFIESYPIPRCFLLPIWKTKTTCPLSSGSSSLGRYTCCPSNSELISKCWYWGSWVVSKTWHLSKNHISDDQYHVFSPAPEGSLFVESLMVERRSLRVDSSCTHCHISWWLGFSIGNVSQSNPIALVEEKKNLFFTKECQLRNVQGMEKQKINIFPPLMKSQFQERIINGC